MCQGETLRAYEQEQVQEKLRVLQSDISMVRKTCLNSFHGISSSIQGFVEEFTPTNGLSMEKNNLVIQKCGSKNKDMI